MNPVLWRELRVMARRPRTSWIITTGLWLCLLIVWFVSGQVSEVVSGAGSASRVGRVLAGVLIMTLSTLIALIAPFVAARALSLERRQETFDVLIITPLTARSILRGKLLGALMPLFYILGATLPLAMILRLYGGFTVAQVLAAYVFLFQETLVFGLLGLAAVLFSGDRYRWGQVGLLSALAFVLLGTPVADLYLRSGFLWWLKLPLVLAVLLWLVGDTTRRLTARRREMEDMSSDLRQAFVFLFFALVLAAGLAWDIGNGGPTLRYSNPLLAASALAGLPFGFEPARANFAITLILYLLLPGAAFPLLAERLQAYFNTTAADERGIFF